MTGNHKRSCYFSLVAAVGTIIILHYFDTEEKSEIFFSMISFIQVGYSQWRLNSTCFALCRGITSQIMCFSLTLRIHDVFVANCVSKIHMLLVSVQSALNVHIQIMYLLSFTSLVTTYTVMNKSNKAPVIHPFFFFLLPYWEFGCWRPTPEP